MWANAGIARHSAPPAPAPRAEDSDRPIEQ